MESSMGCFYLITIMKHLCDLIILIDRLTFNLRPNVDLEKKVGYSWSHHHLRDHSKCQKLSLIPVPE